MQKASKFKSLGRDIVPDEQTQSAASLGRPQGLSRDGPEDFLVEEDFPEHRAAESSQGPSLPSYRFQILDSPSQLHNYISQFLTADLRVYLP